MLPLSQSDWLPPIMAPRPPRATGAGDGQTGQPASNAATAAAAAAARLSGIELKEPPMDWSLKTSLRFTRAQPFNLVHLARTAPRSEGKFIPFYYFNFSINLIFHCREKLTLQNSFPIFLLVIDAERSFTACIGDTDLSPHHRLLAASMTWQYPQNPQPPAQSRPLVGTSVPSHIQQRRKDWQESLCSLYDALRTGQCSAFYVVSPQLPSGVGKHPFSIVFNVAGIKGSERVQAVMGTSSAGVRSLLKMQGVDFEAPLMGNTSNTLNHGGRSANTTCDHTTRSMLVFSGALRVHALFDFLLNRAFTLLDTVCDVPILLAPIQFTHAAIKKFTLTMTNSTSAVAAGKGGARAKGNNNKSTGANTLHTLDVKGGIIPGWVSDRLLRVLTSEESLGSTSEKERNTTTEAGATAVTMVSAPLPASAALNWHTNTPSTSKHGKKKVSVQCFGGCVSENEAAQWCQTLEGLDTAAVREMKFIAVGEDTGKEGEEQGRGTYQIVQATTRVLPLNS